MLAIVPLKIFSLIIFFNICNVVKSQFFDIEIVKSSTLTDSEEIKGPRSITECVMKCQRKTKEGFYTNDNKCFCHKGFSEETGEENGILTRRVEQDMPNNGKLINCGSPLYSLSRQIFRILKAGEKTRQRIFRVFLVSRSIGAYQCQNFWRIP